MHTSSSSEKLRGREKLACLLVLYIWEQEPLFIKELVGRAEPGGARVYMGTGKYAGTSASNVEAMLVESGPIRAGTWQTLKKVRIEMQHLSDIWPTQPTERLAAEFSLPLWLAKRWNQEHGHTKGGVRALAAVTNVPGPVTLRVNALRCRKGDDPKQPEGSKPKQTTRETLISALAQEGIVAREGKLSPWAVQIISPPKPNVWGSKCWQEGWFEVQDEGSQVS